MAIGKPSYKRSVRLRELFLQEISKGLKDLKDPGISGLLTITDLDLSRDRKTARVYYSLLGLAKDRDSTQKALERCVGFLRQKVLAKLRMKIIPKLVFVFDDTPAQAQKIEDALNRIREEDGVPPAFRQAPSDQLDRLASDAKPRRHRRTDPQRTSLGGSARRSSRTRRRQ